MFRILLRCIYELVGGTGRGWFRARVQVMRDVAAFPPDGGAVDDGVDRKMRLATFEPGSRVVGSAQGDGGHE